MSDTQSDFNFPYLLKRLRGHGHEEVMVLTRTAADAIVSLRTELADLRDGNTVILPKDRKHAEAMHLVAQAFLSPPGEES